LPENYFVRKFVLSLQGSQIKKKMNKSVLTEKENELIEAIRNYKNSKHNPSKELELYAIRLFELLLYEEDED
jgi:hypothetical protein